MGNSGRSRNQWPERLGDDSFPAAIRGEIEPTLQRHALRFPAKPCSVCKAVNGF